MQEFDRWVAPTLLQIFRQPCLHLAPPDDAVLGLGDPVALIGEPDIAAGHAQALEAGEHAQALRIGNAEVECAVDHQRWRSETARIGARGTIAIVFGPIPGEATVLPLGEPELLGRAVHADQVEDASVADQGLEPVSMPADPVHHEAAVRAASRRELGLVEERVLLKRAVETLHEVLVNLAGPVLADLVGELLAVAGRASG